MTELTGKCSICGATRPNNKISVLAIKILDVPEAIRHINYCNDNPDCYAGAVEIAEKERKVISQ